MPSRAGRSARGLGSGRGGDAGGRGGEGGHRRPSPVLSGVLGGRLRPRRHAELAESPFSSPLGRRPATRSGAAAPRGGSEASGRVGGAGGGQARCAPLWRTPGDRARCAVPRPGRCCCRRAGGRTREAAAACGKLAGARSRPAALSSNYRADRSAAVRAARSTCQAEGDRRRATRAGVPRGTFLERDGVGLFFKGRFVAWIFLGAPKAIKKLFETKQFLALQPSQLPTSSLILRRLSQPDTWVEDET